MGNGALAIGPKLPRPSSTLPERTLGRSCRGRFFSFAVRRKMLAYLNKAFAPEAQCNGASSLRF